MNNFPYGAADDKNAPFNTKDPEIIPWDRTRFSAECLVCGEHRILNNEEICEDCYNEDPDYYTEED